MYLLLGLTAAAALANSFVAFLCGDVTEAESSLVSKEKADIVKMSSMCSTHDTTLSLTLTLASSFSSQASLSLTPSRFLHSFNI